MAIFSRSWPQMPVHLLRRRRPARFSFAEFDYATAPFLHRFLVGGGI
jgi:hypothetical protein